ncbi:MAG: BON domain-containing protein [Azonexus sp.]
MQKAKLTIAAAALITALPLLQGCVPAVIATGATVGVMSYQDRRPTAIQTEDESIEWKASRSVPEKYSAASHLNFTAFNRRLMITGEVPSEEAKNAIGEQAAKVAGVKDVFNEVTVGPASSLSTRSNDSYITSKVKGRLVDEKYLSAIHIKVVTEAGIAYLMGIVSERESKLAVTIASRTDGVRKVVNLFEVLGDAEIKRLDAPPGATKPASEQPAPVENR